MKDGKLRVVVKELVSREDIDLIAWENQWVLCNEVRFGENNPYQKIWTTTDEQTAIHYIEDHWLQVRYLQVKGSEPEKVIKQIRSSLKTYDRDEICQMVERATKSNESINAIYKACIAAPQQYDPEFFELFEKAFSNSDPDVRRAAIFATAYVGWGQFKPALEHLKKTDADVSKDAEVMLEGLELHNWK